MKQAAYIQNLSYCRFTFPVLFLQSKNIKIINMRTRHLAFIAALAFSVISYSQIDMTITNVSFQLANNIRYNNTNTIRATVRNIGLDTLKTTLNTEVFLSRDQIYDAGDLLLANQVTGDIAPGAEREIFLSNPFSYGQGAPAILQSNYEPGNYYIIAITNFYRIAQSFALPEITNTNNIFVLPTTLSVPNTDLRIVSANIPDTLTLGDNEIDYTYTIDGTDSIHVMYSDGFSISKDSILGIGDIGVGSLGLGGGNAGETRTYNDLRITVPAQTLMGDYYFFAKLDNPQINYGNVVSSMQDRIAETNENNNIIRKRVYVKGLDVDIALQSILCDSVAQRGTALSIAINTKNTGKVNVGGFKNKYYLSTDTIVDALDILFSTTNSGSTVGLVAGNTTTENISYFINSNTAVGTYYLIAMTDTQNAIAEINETNNKFIKRIQIEAQFRDISINSFSSSTNPVNVSTAFYTSAVFKNNGALSVGSFGNNIYLSTDSILSVNDLKLNASLMSSSSINAGATRNVNFSSLTIPANVSTGSYFLILEADAANVVVEKFENNNIATSRLNVVGFNYDLAVNSIDTYPANVPNNSTFVSFNYTVKNNSNTSIATVNSMLYLSTDSIYDNADVLLVNNNKNANISVGGTNLVALGFSLTNATSPGNYYLIIKTDGNNSFNETNETNNFKWVSIRVDAPFRDLTSQFLTDTVNVVRSISKDVIYRIVNNGNIQSTGSQQIKLFLSNDNVLSPSTDQELTALNISNSISAGTYLQYTRTLNLTNSAGLYYLFAVADFNNTLAESNESNNATYTVIKLEERIVDLTLNTDTLSYVVKLNNAARTFPVKVFNTGNSDVSTSVYLYLSNDSTTNLASKTLIGNLSASINQNSFALANFNYTFNSNTTLPSKKYLYYVTDPTGVFAETNENNNYMIIPIEFKPLYVDMGMTAVSTTVNSVATNEIVSGNTITINATMSNIGTDTSPVTSGITVGIYYSEDNLYQTTDVFIGSRSTGPNFPFSLQVDVPSNTLAGNKFIILYADRQGLVTESDETNNIYAIPIKVIDRTYDFSGQFTNANASDSIIAGTSKVITFSGSNTTNFWAGNTAYTKIYLSTDNQYSANDIDVVGNVSLATNSINNTVTTNATINIPVNQASGNYYLIGFIDYNNGVAETNESNNYFNRPIRIVSRSLDLRVDSVRFDNGNEYQHGMATPTLTLRYGNFGNVPLSFQNYPIIRVLLSQDDVADINDIVLRNYSIPYGSMAVNARYTESVSIFIPTNTPIGEYKLIVAMDANNIFVETNEDNNNTAFNYKIRSITTAMESNLTSNEISLYPNPTTDKLHLKTGIIDYAIYSISGAKVEIGKALNNTIDVAHLTNGIYYLRFTKNDTTHNLKFIKQCR